MSWDLKTEICHWDGEKVYISDVIPMMVKFGEYAKSTSGDIQVREDVIAEELMKHHKIEDLRSVAGVGQ